MNLVDTFTVDAVRRTGDGYLTAFARVARTGVQVYRGSELGRPDLETVRVYRPPEEVFHADAMKSFAHRPVTLRHPSTPVNSKNWRQYAKGQTGDEVVRDGEYVKLPMVMMDQALIDAYERDGIKELSFGYSTDIQWRQGVTDAGEQYDAVQTAIRGNHLAVVPVARGGDQLRIGDGACPECGAEMTGEKCPECDYVKDDLDLGDDKDKLGHGSNKRGGSSVDNSKDPKTIANNFRKVLKEYGVHAVVSHANDDIDKPGDFKEIMDKYTEANEKTALAVAKEMPGIDHTQTHYDNGQMFFYTHSNKKPTTNDEGDYTMKLVIDGLPVNVADERDGAIIQKHIDALTAQIKTITDSFEDFKKKKKDDDDEADKNKKTMDAQIGEIAVLKKQIVDAAITPEKLDVLVKDRLSVVDRAKAMVGADYAFDGKTVETIRKDAVTVKLGDAVVKHMNDAAIEGAFTALVSDGATVTSDRQIGDALRHRAHSAPKAVNDAADKAHDEMTRRTGDAWKTPSAA